MSRVARESGPGQEASGIAANAPACLLCGGRGAEAIGSCASTYTAFAYTLYACRDCGSRFFDPGEHPVSLKEKYDEHAVANAGRYAGGFLRSAYWANEVSRLGALHGRPVRSVLDIGCRTGDFLMHWPAGIERCGIELSSYSAGIARGRGLRVKEGFLEEMEIGEKFDVVSLYAILEHLREPAGFLRYLPDWVERDGIIAILIPTFQSAKAGLLRMAGKQWHMYSPPEHLNFMSRAYLDAAMSGLGFGLIARHYTSGGMFNPLEGIPVLSKAFHRAWGVLERATILNRVPLFDHMYSYYARGASR
jgi:SAM-dependent methyltransferase